MSIGVVNHGHVMLPIIDKLTHPELVHEREHIYDIIRMSKICQTRKLCIIDISYR